MISLGLQSFIISVYRHDRLSHPSNTNSEIQSHPVNTEGQQYNGRRDTHDETSQRVSLTVSASNSKSSVGSSSLSPDPENQFMEDILDDIFTEDIPKVKAEAGHQIRFTHHPPTTTHKPFDSHTSSN